MRTLPSFLRAHHWVVVCYIVAFTASVAFFFDWPSATTALGWALATGWTMSAAIELMALAAGRWWPNETVDRPIRILSPSIFVVLLLLGVFDLLIYIFSRLWWYGSEPSTAFITVLGDGFGDAVYVSCQVLIQWIGLVGVAGLIRSLWRREGMTGAGRFVRSIVFFPAFLWGLILFGIVEDSSFALRHWGFDTWSVAWRIIYFTPFLVTLLVVLWYVFLRIARSWVTRLSGVQAVKTILISLVVTLLPFVVGYALFGPTMRQGKIMYPIYKVVVALFPVFLWIVANKFSRQTPAAERKTR